MKKLFSIISLVLMIQLLSSLNITAQTTKTIGTGTYYTSNFPVQGWYDYSYSFTIYDASEIGMAGIISKIEYSISNNCNYTMNNQNVYLLNTSASSFSNGNYVNPVSMGATLVYNGSVTWNGSGWDGINLQTNFTYNGTDNLMVIWENRDGSYVSGNPNFYYSNGASAKTKYKYQDNSFPTTTGITNTGRPNIRLTLLSLSPNNLGMKEFTSPTSGTSTNANMPVTLKVYNSGSAKQANYDVKYSIDNGSNWTSKTISDSISPYSTNTISFNQTGEKADMSTAGIYQCIAVVKNTGDTLPENDTLRKDITICNGTYSGTYTVGSDTSCYFPSLNTAFDALQLCGVSGSITLKVKDGIYNERIVVPSISGISATNPLTIESFSSNRNSVTFQHLASSSADNYVFYLDSCSYLTIKNITLKAQNSNYSGVIFFNESHNINIESCNIIGKVTNTYNSHNTLIKSENITSYTVHDISINNCTIKNGYTAIYMYGSPGGSNSNLNITNNKILNFYYHGIRTSSFSSILIQKNIVYSDILISDAINLNGGTGNINISRNKVISKNNDAIKFYNIGSTQNTPVNIYNNFINLNLPDYNTNAITLFNTDYANIIYNSVNMTGSSYNSSGIYISSSDSLIMVNNNIINNTNGYCINISGSTINFSNNNNYYTSSNYLAYWQGVNCSNLSALQTQSGMDANSLSTNVSFYSNSDLHLNSSALNDKGTPIAGYTTDIDGQIRDTLTPDIGADEFEIYQNDVGLTSFSNLNSACPGSAQNIIVTLKNMGSAAVSNVKIAYSINGEIKDTITWTGFLGLQNTANATLGTYIFSADTLYNIKAWVNSVNLVIDSNIYNDTVRIEEYHTSLAEGTYQIGSSSTADFSDISSAIDAAKEYGICGPIVFNIESGTYNDQFIIENIDGVSSTNTITFKSVSNNADDVSIEYTSNNYNSAYIFKIESSGNIIFKNLTFSTENSNYSRIIFANNSNNITVDSCKLIGANNNSSGQNNYLFNSYKSGRIHITNSKLNYGYGAFYGESDYGTRYNDIKISNNKISNIYGTAINLNYIGDSLNITSNSITDRSNSYASAFFINYNNYVGSGVIKNNSIYFIGQYVGSIARIDNHTSYGTYTKRLLIYNNYFHINGSISNYINVVKFSSSKNFNFYYNTIKLVASTNYNSYGLYVYNCSYFNIKNNSIDVGNNYVLSYGYSSSMNSDYNNFYSTKSTPFNYSYSDYNFTNYKSSSSSDSHSIFTQPQYISSTDLHMHDTIINGAGTAISGITTDFDGDNRNSSTPDIGADEFVMVPNNAKLLAINSPGMLVPIGISPIRVSLQNYGTANLTSDSIHYQLDTNSIVSTLWTGNIVPLATESYISLGSEAISAGNHFIRIWSTHPNGIGDLDPYNDTLSVSFVAQNMANLTAEPGILTGTITNCGDSIIMPLSIINNGGLTLHYSQAEIDNNITDTISTKVFTQYGDSTLHIFSGLNSLIDTLELTITINGDYYWSNSSKYVTIYADNNYLGTFGKTYSGSNAYDSISYVLIGSQLNNLIRDNKLEIKVVNSSSVSPYYGSSTHKVHIKSWNKHVFKQYGNTTDSLSSADTTTINYTFNATGLNNGNYIGNIKFTSNDIANPVKYVPYNVTVAGAPIMSTSTSSILFNGAYTNVATYDTLEIYNTGCGNLNISNITTSNTSFTALTTADTCFPGDTIQIVYKFLGTTVGSYVATSTIYNNDTNFTFNIGALAILSPEITISTNPMSVTVVNCNDSVTSNLSIQNSGGGTLTATVERGKDSLEILMLTSNTYIGNNSHIVTAINSGYTKYNMTYSNYTTATVIQGIIDSKNIDIIILPNTYSSSAYTSLATTLQNFTTAGGTVMFIGQSNSNIFTNIGLISATRNGSSDYSTLNVQNTSHPLTLNFPSSYSSGTDDFNYYTFTGTGITSILKYGTYDVAVEKSYGLGKVIVIGHYYNSIYTSYTKTIIANAVKRVDENGASWLHFATSTANLSSGSTALKPIIFDATDMATGTYTAQIRITSNSPTNPTVIVPCTLIVQNQMANGIDLGADTTACGSITLDAGTFNNYAWNTGNTTQTISVVSSGIYSVTATSGSCSSSDTINVTINANPTIVFTGLPANGCTNGAPITLTATPIGGSFAGPGLSSGQFYPSMAGLGSHTIFYSYTNASNCSSTASQNITVYYPPVVSFTGLNASYCPQGTASILVGSPSGGAFTGNGIVGNTFVPSLANIGNNSIIYTYTDAHTCSNTDTAITTITTPSFTISITGLQSTYCANDLIDTVIVSPAGGTLSGPGISGNFFDPSIAGLGTHYIKYQKQDGTTCMVADSFQVVVNPIPTGITISGLNQSFCANDASTPLSGFPAGGVFSGLGVSGTSFYPTLSGAGQHIIKYTYTANNGCSNYASTVAYVDPLPVISFVNLQSEYCDNDNAVTINATPIGGTLSGSEIFGGQFNPTMAGSGSYYVYYEYTDANTCYNKDSFNILVNSSPSVNINSIASNFCSNSSPINLGGTPIGGVFSGLGVSGNTFDPAIAGVGYPYLYYTYTDNNGCSNTDSTSTIISQIHGVNAGVDTTISYNTTYQLSGMVLGGSGSFNFAWTPTNSVASASSLSTSTTSLTSSTMFTLTVNDNTTNCVNSDQILVNVSGGPLTSTSSASLTTICENENTQLQALGSGGEGNYTYSWTSVPAGFNSSISSPIVSPDVTTTYNCVIGDGTDTVQEHIIINVNTIPLVSISNLNTSYCNTDGVANLIVSPPGGSLVGGGISGNTFNPANASIGQNMVIYSMTNTNNCYGADTIIVSVGITPSAYAGEDTLLPCLNGGLNLGQQGVSNVSYQWSPPIGLSSATIANPIANPNLSINYSVIATDNNNGCSAYDTVHITVIGAPTAHISDDTLVCPGSSVTLTASGGDTYFWSNGTTTNTTTVIPTVSTLYYVIVSQGGCADLDTVWVNISDPNPDFGPDTTICGNSSIVIDAGAGYVNYLWSTGANSQTITIDSAGVGYNTINVLVQVTDTLSCLGSDDINITFTNCVGMNDVDDNMFTIAIYPNPSKGQFVIESNTTAVKEVEMNITDINGRLIIHKQLKNTSGAFKEMIDLRNEAKGVYFIKLSNNGVNKVFKVIIQ